MIRIYFYIPELCISDTIKSLANPSIFMCPSSRWKFLGDPITLWNRFYISLPIESGTGYVCSYTLNIRTAVGSFNEEVVYTRNCSNSSLIKSN